MSLYIRTVRYFVLYANGSSNEYQAEGFLLV